MPKALDPRGRGKELRVTPEGLAAKNERVFRDITERITDLARAFDTAHRRALCECRDPACTAQIKLPLEEYERVRADGTRFALVPGHEDERIERVVAEGNAYRVVAKIGTGADIAREQDPRSFDRG